MSLRARLTLAVVALLVVTTSVVGLVTVVATRQVLTDQVDDLLRATQLRQGTPLPRDFERRLPDLQGRLPEGVTERLGDDAYQPVARLLVAPDGAVRRAEPAGFPDDPLPVPDRVHLHALGPGISTIDVEGTTYRTLAQPLRGQGGEQLVLLAPLDEVDQTVGDLIVVVVAVAAGAVVVLGAVSWWLIGRSLAPVDRMVDTAAAIAAGDLSQRVEHADDGTELGRLATALDDMLSQLEAAFAEREASEARLRRFVGDASHELRTPLAAIRGYAELYAAGGLPDDEALERAMERIGGESDRMARLVEDLLTLARLDQAQPLAQEPVDLARVVTDVVADARVLDPGRTIELDAAGPSVVTGDEAKLRQVVTNLVANARQHTPEATSVHVQVGPADDRTVEVRVADDGPGVPPELHAKVFERFYRADESRTRATGGAGLGLAIVASVVEAHGGTVALESPPGGGAAFVVRLPRT